MKNKKHGGKRAGAGRNKKYNEPTKRASFRIPESVLEEARIKSGGVLNGYVVDALKIHNKNN